MKKIRLCDLPDENGVFQVVDKSDPDFGKIFVYKGRRLGHNIVEQVGGEEFGVEHLPLFEKLFALDHVGRNNYGAVFQDLEENSLHQ